MDLTGQDVVGVRRAQKAPRAIANIIVIFCRFFMAESQKRKNRSSNSSKDSESSSPADKKKEKPLQCRRRRGFHGVKYGRRCQ